MTAVGSRPKTVDVRSDLQASLCALETWPFAVGTSGSIDRSTILHAVGPQNFRKALCVFLERGMIGDDEDFSGKVCVKWKDTEFER